MSNVPYADPEQKRQKQAEYRRAHREELAAKQALRYRANPGAHHAYATEYRKARPQMDRALRFANSANKRARTFGVPGKLYARDLMKTMALPCLYCGEAAKSWDHIVPMSKGGANTLANLVRCCYACNRRKYTQMPDEWRPDWTDEHWLNGTIEWVLR